MDLLNRPAGSTVVALAAIVGVMLPSIAHGQDVSDDGPAPWWTRATTRPLLPDTVGEDGLPTGWSVIGGPATYAFETGPDGARILHGTGGGPRNAFLVDPTITGDFLLEVDVRLARGEGNSGIQIRSTIDQPRNRMFGYQIEIDPSERAWSGGLYDEGRRGWIASLADNADAREAFDPDEWNHYTILAVGPRIRTWINGVPAVDHVDFTDAAGRIGLQVHSGRCDVRWRDPRIADFGVRSSRTLLGAGAAPGDRVEVEPADGLESVEPGWRFDEDGVVIRGLDAWPEGAAGLVVRTTLERGALRLVLGDAERGPGYVATIPAPLGGPDGPAVIRAWRWSDRMMVFVDDTPLLPGPRPIAGPLTIRLETDPGSIGVLHSIEIDPPTDAERTAMAPALPIETDATPTEPGQE